MRDLRGARVTFPEYHKIHSLYKRTERGELIVGEFARPEFEYLYYNDWICTEKVDGTNIRIGWDSVDGMRWGGRTVNAQIPSFLMERLHAIGEQLRETVQGGEGEFDPDCPVVLYGEGYGAKIQKGGGNYNPDGVDFVLFDVLVGDWLLQRDDVLEVGKLLGLDVVPEIGRCSLDDAEALVRDVGLTSHWGDFEAEGVVCVPVVPLFARDGHRVITKIKHKDYERIAEPLKPFGQGPITDAEFDAITMEVAA